MNNQYIIINKTLLEKRIEELERQIKESSIEETGEYDFQCEDKIEELILVLSQSTPLIPEVEKAFDAGREWGYDTATNSDVDSKTFDNLEEYISNLKLDI